jgi:hypothetical protein
MMFGKLTARNFCGNKHIHIGFLLLDTDMLDSLGIRDWFFLLWSRHDGVRPADIKVDYSSARRLRCCFTTKIYQRTSSRRLKRLVLILMKD